MIKRFLLSSLAALAFCAEAAPINFFNTSFDVLAVATTIDGAAGVDANSSATTLVSASASSVGATDIATAGANAGPGLLSTSADASSTSAITNATSTATFSASFLTNGWLILNLDLLFADAEDGTGSSDTSLFVELTSDGNTLFGDYVSASRQFAYNLNGATSATLALTLSSQATAGFPTAGAGDASAFGLVTFDGTIPVPATPLLVLLGLGMMVVVRKHQPRAISVA
jgi:hypothetical protein